MEQKAKRKQEMNYWVDYMYPTDGGAYSVDFQRITPGTFNAEIPSGVIGYQISYGSDNVRYKSYSIYKGQVLSFADAREIFPYRRFSPEITAEMIKNGETTEKLKKKFSEKVDLQHKFEKFVEECEQMEFPKNFFGNTKSSENPILEQGVVVMAGINYPKYLYSRDFVILQ